MTLDSNEERQLLYAYRALNLFPKGIHSTREDAMEYAAGLLRKLLEKTDFILDI